MRMSEEKQTELYAAIHEPIMKMRIKYLREFKNNELDDQLFKLNNDIWSEVHLVLNLG